ncbi:MAG TPA: transposase [Verrucomicrobiota bacterium]|nr:transposase [Verrucomicrobiota bacterium]
MSSPRTVRQALWGPVEELLGECAHQRACPELLDGDWIRLGLDRALHEVPSGRAYLQQHGFQFERCPPLAHYFEALKSERRCRLVRELNGRLCQRVAATLPDALGAYADLANFDVYAGDGHWHGAAVHDARTDGTKHAVGHFYALDLRRHTLRHLAAGIGLKEHDMHVLKRLEPQALRQQAPVGRQVLWVWDKAGIDFHAWHRWKQAHGLYFVSREKENMALAVQGLPAWDRQDPVDAGVQSVELVAGQAGVLVRRIRYVEPVTGTEYVFLTNELTIRPGLIAFLYKLRWDLEKVFDELKNKLNEQKAWATSLVAKAAQAQFLCLLHNLLLLVEGRLEHEGIVNHAEQGRKAQELERAQAHAAKAGRKFPSPILALRRLTQRSVKLLRWLRASLWDNLPWTAATPSTPNSSPNLGHRSARALYCPLLLPRHSHTTDNPSNLPQPGAHWIQINVCRHCRQRFVRHRTCLPAGHDISRSSQRQGISGCS